MIEFYNVSRLTMYILIIISLNLFSNLSANLSNSVFLSPRTIR